MNQVNMKVSKETLHKMRTDFLRVYLENHPEEDKYHQSDRFLFDILVEFGIRYYEK